MLQAKNVLNCLSIHYLFCSCGNSISAYSEINADRPGRATSIYKLQLVLTASTPLVFKTGLSNIIMNLSEIFALGNM
jgi:hypothetical protein